MNIHRRCLLDMGDRLGTIEVGQLADVIVDQGRVFIARHEPRPEPGAGGTGAWR